MPSWKKVIVSGSNASLNSLTVSTNVTAQSFTGSLEGTASWARNSLTASFITGSNVYGPFGSNSVISASYAATASLATRSVTSSYPIDVVGTTLFSVQPKAGPGFDETHSIYFGEEAGAKATNTYHSNYLGFQAGYSASNANNSNFFGQFAGYSASNANNSNFIGYQAGYTAIGSTLSNFLGYAAGAEANNSNQSNFLGYAAGAGAENAYNSNFLGYTAGNNAVGAYQSNFLGVNAGYLATAANNSNFLGQGAGQQADSASHSNFIGTFAGYLAAGAVNSNFLGQGTGEEAYSASYSTLLGYHVGYNAAATTGIGPNNIIIGTNITLADSRRDSINLGAIIFATGSYSTTTGNPLSGSVGNGRVGINVVNPVYNLDVSGSGNFTNGLTASGSVRLPGLTNLNQAFMVGYDTATGQLYYQNSGSFSAATASFVTASNVYGPFGSNSILSASFAVSSSRAQSAVSSSYPLAVTGSTIYSTISNLNLSGLSTFRSIIIGLDAGLNTTTAFYANFFGNLAGAEAVSASNSNFFGREAGYLAVNASNSNFLGNGSGYQATNAQYSNFIGLSAGSRAISASYTALVGYNVGNNGFGKSIGPNNVIIGTNITVADSRRDTINLGAIIFATGSYSTTSGNAFSGSVGNGRVGVNVVNPVYNLDVSGSGNYTNGLTVTGSLIAPNITGSLRGTASWALNTVTASYALFALSASYAATSSYAVTFNVSQSLTASGLNYPIADNGEESFIQTDGNGTLSLQYVKTIYENIYNGEATNLIKGTPVYVSGAVGDAAQVFRADAGDSAKMPVVYVSADTIAPGEVGRGIALGLIKGVDTTGYPAGTEIYIAVGGGWTSTRPTGSAIVQVLGYITKEGSGGQGVVLNPGPANLPNLTSGSVWVGNSGSVPVAVPTASLSVAFAVSASNSQTASYVLNAVSASFATTASFAQTASYALNAISASFAATASSADNFLVRGTLTAQTIVAQTITSSVSFITGSTKFGTLLTNTHQFTGSVSITGSLRMNAGLTMTPEISTLYTADGTLSYYAVNNGVYLNGAGSGGWLRLNGSGVENGTNAIDIFGSSGNRIVFRTNNVERARIDSSGNLGIGTAAPSARLDVSGSTKLGTTTDQTHQLTGSVSITGSLSITGNTTARTNFYASLLDTRVGIGTSSPSYQLEVKGNTGTTVNTSMYFDPTSEYSRLYVQTTGAGGGGGAVVSTKSGSAEGNLITWNDGSSLFGVARRGWSSLVHNGGSGLMVGTENNTPLIFGTNNVERGRFTSTGLTVTGSLIAPSITGSLQGTSSWALNAVTASYALNAISSSFASTASYVNQLFQAIIVTGSGATSATSALTIVRSNLTSSLIVRDGIGNTSTTRFLTTFDDFKDTTFYPANHWRSGSIVTAQDITLGSDRVLGGFSSRLNFMTYYSNGGQGPQTNMAAYVRSTISQYIATGGPSGNQQSGRGTLLLGVYDSDYSSNVLNSFDVIRVGKYDTSISGSVTITGSLIATSFTGSLLGTASWAQNAITSSYVLNAVSASFASTASFVNPLNQTVIITGSLNLSSSLHSAGGNTAAAATTTTVITVATGSYTAGFFDYTVASGSNARAGTLMTVWNGSNIQYTDNSTLDIGSTAGIVLDATLSGANVLFRATTTSTAWTVKSTYRLI